MHRARAHYGLLQRPDVKERSLTTGRSVDARTPGPLALRDDDYSGHVFRARQFPWTRLGWGEHSAWLKRVTPEFPAVRVAQSRPLRQFAYPVTGQEELGVDRQVS